MLVEMVVEVVGSIYLVELVEDNQVVCEIDPEKGPHADGESEVQGTQNHKKEGDVHEEELKHIPEIS